MIKPKLAALQQRVSFFVRVRCQACDYLILD